MKLKVAMHPDWVFYVEISERVGGLKDTKFTVKYGNLFPLRYSCRLFIPSLEWMHCIDRGSVVLSWFGDFVIVNQVTRYRSPTNPAPESMTVYYKDSNFVRDLDLEYVEGKILKTTWASRVFWNNEASEVEEKIKEMVNYGKQMRPLSEGVQKQAGLEHAQSSGAWDQEAETKDSDAFDEITPDDSGY